jgi:hypothetical protein
LEVVVKDESDVNPAKETQGASEIPGEVTTTDSSSEPMSSQRQEDANAETGIVVCKGQKPDGTPCSVAPLPGANFCFFHAPELHARRREAQALGGRQNRATTLSEDVPDVKIRERRDVARLLADTINDVRKGRVDPRIATAIGYLGNILISIVKEDELEKRIEQLEATSRFERIRR